MHPRPPEFVLEALYRCASATAHISFMFKNIFCVAQRWYSFFSTSSARFNARHSPKNYFEDLEIYQWRWFEESGQWLENVYRIHLVVASGKLVLQINLYSRLPSQVVNDPQAGLWKRLEIICWPTILVLDPFGKPIKFFIGEGKLESLREFVKVGETKPCHVAVLRATFFR